MDHVSERERLIDYFERLAAGEVAIHQPRVRDASLRLLLRDFEDETRMTLPMNPRDNTSPFLYDRAVMRRAICFLRTEQTYVSPEDEGWSIFGVLLVGGVAMALIGGAMSAADVACGRWLVIVGLVASLGWFVPLYALGQLFAAIHVIQVRVLRRDYAHLVDCEHWPFPSVEAWRAAEDLSQRSRDSRGAAAASPNAHQQGG